MIRTNKCILQFVQKNPESIIFFIRFSFFTKIRVYDFWKTSLHNTQIAQIKFIKNANRDFLTLLRYFQLFILWFNSRISSLLSFDTENYSFHISPQKPIYSFSTSCISYKFKRSLLTFFLYYIDYSYKIRYNLRKLWD